MDDVIETLQGISPDELTPPEMWFDGSGRLCPVAILGIRRGIDVQYPFMFDFIVRVANAYGVPTKVMKEIASYHDRGYEPVHIARTIALEYGNE